MIQFHCADMTGITLAVGLTAGWEMLLLARSEPTRGPHFNPIVIKNLSKLPAFFEL